MTHDEQAVQLIAEALWQVATSENKDLAWYRSASYRNLERAFIATVREVYRLGETRARLVRDLLAEYGPHDSLYDTHATGVASYVEYALTHRR